MVKYTLRRLVQAIPTLFGITLISFMLMIAAPGGPETILVGNPRITAQQREQLAVRLGVRDPWYVQYIRWLIGNDWQTFDMDGDGEPESPGQRQGILRGDFGFSLGSSRRPVTQIIGERVLPTLELGITSLILSICIGVPVGILAAVRRGGVFDNASRVVSVIFNAVPIFWLGLILILFFGVLLPNWLHMVNPEMFPDVSPLLPMGNQCPISLTGECPPIYNRINHLLLPTFVLSTGGIAVFSRFMRASMLDVIGQDYVRTAKAKGLSPRTVWYTHAARNALIPIATFLGPAIFGVLSGAAITERIFSWPGLGQLAVSSVFAQDYPVVMAVVIISALATIFGYILSDILYALIDPRIRFS
jgi:peptide/nickel transport system permease protein